ncbi:SLC13 family permease [Streptomyces sp. NPDC003247]|uniref:SLC13 family permease n=1 Tax=Streptomyces sp. NPDC003247 TaxID=3364677 RepID=UPI0036A00E49
MTISRVSSYLPANRYTGFRFIGHAPSRLPSAPRVRPRARAASAPAPRRIDRTGRTHHRSTRRSHETASRYVAATAALLLFAVPYFGLMTEVKLFDPISAWIIRASQGDPLRIVVGTAALSLLVALDGDGTTSYMIICSALLPIYRFEGFGFPLHRDPGSRSVAFFRPPPARRTRLNEPCAGTSSASHTRNRAPRPPAARSTSPSPAMSQRPRLRAHGQPTLTLGEWLGTVPAGSGRRYGVNIAD